jgi:hypothetical protein
MMFEAAICAGSNVTGPALATVGGVGVGVGAEEPVGVGVGVAAPDGTAVGVGVTAGVGVAAGVKTDDDCEHAASSNEPATQAARKYARTRMTASIPRFVLEAISRRRVFQRPATANNDRRLV